MTSAAEETAAKVAGGMRALAEKKLTADDLRKAKAVREARQQARIDPAAIEVALAAKRVRQEKLRPQINADHAAAMKKINDARIAQGIPPIGGG